MTASARPAPPRVEAGDYYERLGLPRSSTAPEIKRAYNALVRQYTPERSPQEFKRIREAYEILSDPTRRSQYDGPPASSLDALVVRAHRALRDREHDVAVWLCKQVLALAPDRHEARALLGACLLQQGRHGEAIKQLERVVASGAATPIVLARLAEGCRGAKRFGDAEEWYRAAMAYDDDDAPAYCASLAEMLIERGELPRARALLRARVAALPLDSGPAFMLMAQLIDIAVRTGRRTEASRHIGAVARRAVDSGVPAEAAVCLGVLAWELIEREEFRVAVLVAQAAVALEPRAADYDALERLATVLFRNDVDAAARLIETHVSFLPRGSLHSDRAWVEWYCGAFAACKGLRPVRWAPPLTTVAGCGFKLRGRQHTDAPSSTFVATCYFQLLGVPLVRLWTYRARTLSGGAQRLVGHVPRPKPRVEPVRAKPRSTGGGRVLLTVIGVAIAMRVCSAILDDASPAPSSSVSVAATPRLAPVVTPEVSGDSLTTPQDADAAAPFGALADYRGIFVSDGGVDTARLVIGLRDTGNISRAALAVSGRPGWFGTTIVATKGGHVVMLSSMAADTLAFFGDVNGDTLAGTWHYQSGRRSGQHGRWVATRRAGLRLPVAEYRHRPRGEASTRTP